MALGLAKTKAALEAGDRIMVTHPNPEKVAQKISYGLAGAGKVVSAIAFRRLLRDGEIAPVPDGFFGSDMCQTFVLAPA